MKVIDKLNCPFDYNCENCKNVKADDYLKISCVCIKKYDICPNVQILSKNDNSHHSFAWQRILKQNYQYILCGDYESN